MPAGGIKARTYDLGETNIANLGTPLEKAVRKAAAETEDAWHGAGVEFGIVIWRIEKFQVVAWPEEQYGNFYSGDSYIVLHTYKKKDAQGNNTGGRAWDIHFWIGNKSSQDEYGTAAYKTVELDDFLGTRATQYREVQGEEHRRFQDLFPNVKYLEGGVATGFKHVEPTKYEHRLLHVKGKAANVVVRQVDTSYESLNSGDTFLYDAGLTIFVWHGQETGPFEKQKGAQLARAMDDERGGQVQVYNFEEGMEDDDFFEAIGGKGPVKSRQEAGADDKVKSTERLVKISDNSGKLEMKTVAEGKALRRDMLNRDDVFLVDDGFEVICWVGLDASIQERKQALNYAAKYLHQYEKPLSTPISKVLQGGENEIFEQVFEGAVMAGFNKDATYSGDIDKVRALQKTKSAAASMLPGGSYTKGPGATTDFDNFYRMEGVDPADWKGRSKAESKYAKELQAAKYGAYSQASGWVSGKTTMQRKAHQSRVDKLEGLHATGGLSTTEQVLEVNKDLTWVDQYKGRPLGEESKKSLLRSSKKQLVDHVNDQLIVDIVMNRAAADGRKISKSQAAGEASTAENAELRQTLDGYAKLFAESDSDAVDKQDGEIGMLELQKCFESMDNAKTRIQLKKMMRLLDKDGDGDLNYAEFATLMLMEDGFIDPPAEAFQ